MTKTSIFTDNSPAAAAARRDIAAIDCDIEGMAKDERISALCDQWRAEGIPKAEFTRRLIEAVKSIEPAIAAE